MDTIILLSEKTWHEELFIVLQKKFNEYQWIHIKNKETFTFDYLNKQNPIKIFIPHWSYIIPENIYKNFECVVFHMTDLPYGRGGSPLQNLIVRGHKDTKISALKVEKGLDTGPIYLKSALYLLGTAEEIFIRTNSIIEKMIISIIDNKLIPIPQQGEATAFKRRKPADSNIAELVTIEQVYDYIRMLDAEGYPNAFLEMENFRLEFSRASIKSTKTLLADVRIIQK